MNHALSLRIEDTLNQAIFRVSDESVYDSNIPVECPLLEITLPGFGYAVQLNDTQISQGFSLNLTACDLEVQTENCGSDYKNLPDGIYIVKYSVSPNDKVYVEYNYLRVSRLMNKYQQILCDIDLSACDPRTEVAEKIKLLNQIKMYIDAAKAKVEVCHEPRKGMELYSYAKKLLNKFECKSCY